jgi:hypothetical protein
MTSTTDKGSNVTDVVACTNSSLVKDVDTVAAIVSTSSINTDIDVSTFEVIEIPAPDAEQRLALQQMKERITYKNDDDRLLYRFLRARKYDVKKAVAMYEEMMEWRKENHIDKILKSPDPNENLFQCICPHMNHGFDRHGHPVYYERTGLVRMAELLKYCTEDQVIERHIRYMEYVARRCKFISEKLGKPVEKAVMIVDLTGMQFTIESAGMRCFKRTTNIDQKFYPESLFRMVIINAPMSFRGVWAIAKPWLDPVTQAKIQIVGSKYQKVLKEFIPHERLPAMYGGGCNCNAGGNGTCLPDVKPWPNSEPQKPWEPITLRGEM